MRPAGYDAALERAVVVDRSDRGLVRVYGRDPARMIQGLVSNDVLALQPGHATYATMLTAKGRMIADLRVIRRADDLLLEADLTALPGIRDTLKRFVPPLFARAEDVGGLSILGVYGPAATQIVSGLFATVPAAVGHADAPDRDSDDDPSAASAALDELKVDDAAFASFGQSGIVLIRTDYAGVDGWDIVAESTTVSAVREELLAAGVETAPLETLEVLRIEAGQPRWGAELTADVIPLEAGLKERAISTSKGCYTGQEVIIRVLHRGHVNRNLRGLLFAPGVIPEPGTALFRSVEAKAMAGRNVGVITSATFSPRLGRAVGLGYVRREVEPGESLHPGSTDGPASVTVADHQGVLKML